MWFRHCTVTRQPFSRESKDTDGRRIQHLGYKRQNSSQKAEEGIKRMGQTLEEIRDVMTGPRRS